MLIRKESYILTFDLLSLLNSDKVGLTSVYLECLFVYVKNYSFFSLGLLLHLEVCGRFSLLIYRLRKLSIRKWLAV